MRIASFALAAALCACASSKETSRDAAVAQPPRGNPPFATAAGGRGTMEGAAALPREDGPCERDEDCGFTKVEPGGCCPMLCTPRVVTTKRARELEDRIPTCSRDGACPEPLCRPPRMTVRPACVDSRCVAQTSPRPIPD